MDSWRINEADTIPWLVGAVTASVAEAGKCIGCRDVEKEKLAAFHLARARKWLEILANVNDLIDPIGIRGLFYANAP